MTRCFADTFFFLALLNESDKAHDRAVALMHSFAGRMVRTRWVLMELGDALAGRVTRTRCAAYLRFLESESDVEIVDDNPHSFDRALRLYEQRPDKEWSLTDCASFVVMQQRRIKQALTGDHHFEQAGFVALLK
jgi:predicted nucleic acid-binding protein